MKKLIFPLLVVLLMGITTSCSDSYYVFQNVTVTKEYKVTANDWLTKDGLGYYYAPLNIEAITGDVERYGKVDVYIYDNEAWNPLPYVYPYEAEDGSVWGENIRYEWNVGRVNFIIQDLNGKLPEDMRNFPDVVFKVCITM